ncbi:MAG: aspartate/glutamate racemase family protein [Aeromicrobium erythreum]
MTTAIGACASAVAGPDVVVEAVSPVFGPESIESHVDEALAVPGVLARVAEGEEAGVDGYVVACFGDPGVQAARELARGPVVGIAEAGMRAATYLGRRFSVVTTLQRTVPGIEALMRSYGLADHCGGVHATEIGGGRPRARPTRPRADARARPRRPDGRRVGRAGPRLCRDDGLRGVAW